MRTTLNKIREHEPCADGWKKLLAYLGKTKADDEPLPITTIIDSNGLQDALWCLRAVEGKDREIRLFAVWCARQVQRLLKDKRSRDALDVAERYANGQDTEEELVAAGYAARDAARDAIRYDAGAAWAARAAWAAAWDAAAEAAWDAARAAAEAAARSAAWDTARAAAEAAARDAARDAAWDAARANQAAELRRICGEIEG